MARRCFVSGETLESIPLPFVSLLLPVAGSEAGLHRPKNAVLCITAWARCPAAEQHRGNWWVRKKKNKKNTSFQTPSWKQYVPRVIEVTNLMERMLAGVREL